MELQDADSLLDGGTTCLTVLDGSETRCFTIGHIFTGKTPFSREKQLPINSEEEKQFVKWLKNMLIAEFGEVRVQEFIEGRPGNFGEEKWLCALNFLRITAKEREYI
ncbi:MAG: hypothetical protein ACFFD4_09670 [Candidatus Odinarchaeota archaeon]